MTDQIIIAIVGVLATLVVYVLMAFANAQVFRDNDAFLFAPGLTSARISSNVAASFSSLAGPFFFFLFQAPLFGWMLILLLPVQWLGQNIFTRIAKKSEISPQHAGSISRLLRHKSGDGRVAGLANFIAATTFFLLLLIELIIGASIFRYLLPNVGSGELIGMSVIGIIALIYILIGGFRVVTFTDHWQFELARWSIALCVVLVIVSYLQTPEPKVNIFTVFISPTASILILGAFLLNTFATNLTQATVQISSWQRLASAKNTPDLIKGVNSGAVNFLSVWLGSILIGGFIFAAQGSIAGIPGLFDYVQNIGLLGTFVAFPLLFVGFTAAMISTVDSMMVALMLGIDDFRSDTEEKRKQLQLTLNRSRVSADETQFMWRDVLLYPQARFALVGVLALTLAVLAYLALNSVSPDWKKIFIQLMFAGYGQSSILFPVIWVYVTRLNKEDSARIAFLNRYVRIGLVTGFLAFWIATIVAIIEASLALSLVSPVIGLLATGLFTGVGYRALKRAPQN